jgi:hypothetical protein
MMIIPNHMSSNTTEDVMQPSNNNIPMAAAPPQPQPQPRPPQPQAPHNNNMGTTLGIHQNLISAAGIIQGVVHDPRQLNDVAQQAQLYYQQQQQQQQPLLPQQIMVSAAELAQIQLRMHV